MSNVNNSADMNLPIPAVGIETGPQYATDLNSCLTIIDSHNHSAGSGVQITPAGINISSDLSLNDNNLTMARSLRLLAQPSALSGGSDLGCLYEVGVDLYYNDGSGNQVRITQSGGVAGSPGSIGGLVSPATVTYVAPTYVFQSAALTAGNLDAGSVIFRNVSASSNGVTLSCSASLGSNYSLVLPAIPAQTNVMTLDNSGNMGSTTWDAVGQAMTSVGANAIGTSMNSTGANAVAASRTRTVATTVGIGGIAISTDSGGFTTSSTSFVDITNLAVTITTSGRPVVIATMGDTNPGGIQFSTGSATTVGGQLAILNGSTPISLLSYHFQANAQAIVFPPSTVFFIDTPSAGTYTYKLQAKSELSAITVSVTSVKLTAYEL